MGKSNKVEDALGHYPQLNNEGSSDTSSKESETVSSATICEDITSVINGEKLPLN